MNKLLKLQHHRHTAKRLPHKHTSYRALILLLLIAGLTMTFIQNTRASEFQVTAKIQAEIPTTPAVISEPVNGSNVDQQTITVSGNCPIITPAILVNIWNGSQIIGSVQCKPDGKFNLFVSLQPGSNKLTPKILTVTGSIGLDGTETIINYNNTKNSPIPDITNTPSQLVLTSNVPFVIFTTNSTVSLEVYVKGGQQPYQLSVDWGDGYTETKTLNKEGTVSNSHKYTDAVSRRITFRIFDNAHNTSLLQVPAISLVPQAVSSISPNIVSGLSPTSLVKLPVIWLAYSTVSLTAIGFWAGEFFGNKYLSTVFSVIRKIPIFRKG